MILVTGGTGFIGSHLLEKLASENEQVRCLVRRRRLSSGVESATGDLATGEGIEEALQDVDTVIHLAGVTKALRTADYYDGNVRATEMTIQASNLVLTLAIVICRFFGSLKTYRGNNLHDAGLRIG